MVLRTRCCDVNNSTCTHYRTPCSRYKVTTYTSMLRSKEHLEALAYSIYVVDVGLAQARSRSLAHRSTQDIHRVSKKTVPTYFLLLVCQI